MKINNSALGAWIGLLGLSLTLGCGKNSNNPNTSGAFPNGVVYPNGVNANGLINQNGVVYPNGTGVTGYGTGQCYSQTGQFRAILNGGVSLTLMNSGNAVIGNLFCSQSLGGMGMGMNMGMGWGMGTMGMGMMSNLICRSGMYGGYSVVLNRSYTAGYSFTGSIYQSGYVGSTMIDTLLCQ